MKKLILVWLLLAAYHMSFSQETSEVLNNSTIIKLYQLELSESIIISKIKGSETDFDVSVDGLIALKKAGISDAIVNEMMESASSQSLKNADPNDPSAPHSAGIYYYDETNQKMIKLEPTTYNQTKISGAVAQRFSYGIAKQKAKATIPNSQAVIQLNEHHPIFYFYFENTETGLSNSGYSYVGATSPNEFTLAHLDQTQGSRELQISSSNIAGSQSGIDEKHLMPFGFERISEGVYKVHFDQPIATGEYCFFYTGSGAQSNKVFDFGVK